MAGPLCGTAQWVMARLVVQVALDRLVVVGAAWFLPLGRCLIALARTFRHETAPWAAARLMERLVPSQVPGASAAAFPSPRQRLPAHTSAAVRTRVVRLVEVECARRAALS